ncbi:nitrite reductase small subunit NirD [Winogradskyella endarachnes]|uniref:Nitrite reductase small subunit NirD n=1 Tax=Winogradskyella endarachnes TaxID=2681965 RepID=A0A6L6UA59_9FLAO|nr:nitrite reductase small subunit NirD [Winogradskyella endarachnes]MUU79153.1 nitrite reductase small subunit NirD [Winogradskyella endarachnes]
MENILNTYTTTKLDNVNVWFKAALVSDFPKDGGACVKYKDKQIAVFNFERTQTWYACQNLCPHKLEMVLSRGMIGDQGGIPKVACPMHKKTFSLETGENLNGNLEAIATYPVKIENNIVYIGFSE